MKITFNLEKIRQNKNLTQKDVARMSGLSQSHVSELESGLKSPTLATIEKLINGLDIKLKDILSEEI